MVETHLARPRQAQDYFQLVEECSQVGKDGCPGSGIQQTCPWSTALLDLWLCQGSSMPSVWPSRDHLIDSPQTVTPQDGREGAGLHSLSYFCVHSFRKQILSADPMPGTCKAPKNGVPEAGKGRPG